MPTINRASALNWCGALISPFVLALAVTNPASDPVLRIVLVILAVLLPAGLLPRRPLPVLLLTLFSLTAVTTAGNGLVYQRITQALLATAACVAVGVLAASRSRWASLPGAAAALLVGAALIGFVNPGAMLSVLAAEVLAVITAWVIGNSVRQRARFTAAQREQAEARAVQAERLRIARELHDMIAHSIGVIAIQAGVGRRVIDTQPTAARDALAAIEDTSRDTLAALRRMLGTLRRSDPEPADVPLDPAPGLADLGGLIARTRDAGVQIDFSYVGSHYQLPPDIDLSAFRIIQEAVTNVIRHADTPRCQVTVSHRPQELSIEITDEGQAAAWSSLVEAGWEGHSYEPGHGITGMRERVSLLDGEFAAVAQPGGGFRVAARIPLPDDSATGTDRA
jgi:signal transduction histidine kinase